MDDTEILALPFPVACISARKLKVYLLSLKAGGWLLVQYYPTSLMADQQLPLKHLKRKTCVEKSQQHPPPFVVICLWVNRHISPFPFLKWIEHAPGCRYMY